MDQVLPHPLKMASEHYTLIFEDHPEYLFAHAYVKVISLDLDVQYINETMAHLRETGAAKMLFVRETPVLVSGPHYSIICSVIVNMVPQEARVALVDQSPSRKIVTELINAQAMEKKRNIKAFESREHAEEWLRAA